MLSHKDNELMCRVEGDAPMGQMLRQHFWLPAVRAARLEPDGAPVRVRLLGEDFVAWRATDGRLGFFDERCPHRGVSLALGVNRDCTLTCIFHGWKFGVDGKVVEVPTEGENSEAFAKTVPLRHYPAREAAGIVWVWLGAGDTPPAFWNLPFMALPDDRFSVVTQLLDANWVQGVEGTIDSSHVGVLHQSWFAEGYATGLAGAAKATAVNYEFVDQPYGYTASATRNLGEEKYVRVTEFVLPWFGMIPPESPPYGDRTTIFAAPTDDTHMMQFFVRYNPYMAAGKDGARSQVGDPDCFAPIGSAEDHWGQDRELMKSGHWTGFKQLVAEDFATQVSQGPLADREKEYLSSSDQFVIRVRRGLLKAVREFMDGKAPSCAPNSGIDYSKIMPRAATIELEQPWQSIEAPATLEEA